MKIAVPITPDGQLDPRWGRAARVAVADILDGEVRGWTEHDVGWDVAHDEGAEGAHHARIARFLREHGVEAIAVQHVGAGMHRMLPSMHVRIVDGLSGDAREAAVAAG